jgi:molybdopterin converting factor small subunit
MQVHVEYVAQVRTAAGVSSESLTVPDGSTVQTLVVAACEQHEELVKVLCSEAGKLHPSILVFRGEEQCDVDSVLTDGDTITFLSPISGG